MAESRTIWKFGLSAISLSGMIGFPNQGFDVPSGGEIRLIEALSPLEINIWIELNEDAPPTHRIFEVYGTGDSVPKGRVWRGSAVAPNRMVWHVYELPAAEVTPLLRERGLVA